MNHLLTEADKFAAAHSIDLPSSMEYGTADMEDIYAFADAISSATTFRLMGRPDYHADGTQAGNGQVFVFGSNLAGVHGAGAARAAMDRYGAVYGEGVGMTGNSYAIPTKDKQIKTLGLVDIALHVANFKIFAASNPEMKFFVTRVGCGLAGYADEDIAPMFRGSPPNCDFPSEWGPYLEPGECALSLVDAYHHGQGDGEAWCLAANNELIRLQILVRTLAAKTGTAV